MSLISQYGIGMFFVAAMVTAGVSQESAQPKVVRSKISVLDIGTKQVKVVYTGDTLWEAPNWSPDGKYLLANSGGKLYRLALDKEKPQPEAVNLDTKYQCNNDHGISADGKLIAFSAWTEGAKGSQVYVANADGSNPRLVTEKAPSYYHGWSPDGKWLAFVAERGDGNFDIYRVPAEGGAEERLTSHKGYDDGPDYSPNGKWIYINTDRSGTWDVWRFPAEGAGENDAKAERVTSDEWEDWFPHPSPDGKWMVFLSFPKGTKGHDGRMNIRLRMMPTKGDKAGGAIQTAAEIVGGQGTINVNSWSPDSRKFAFVSYELE
jgi:TolB protein